MRVIATTKTHIFRRKVAIGGDDVFCACEEVVITGLITTASTQTLNNMPQVFSKKAL